MTIIVRKLRDYPDGDILLGWDPVPDAEGYQITHSLTTRKPHTWKENVQRDPTFPPCNTRVQGGAEWYRVKEIEFGEEGEYRPDAEDPSTVTRRGIGYMRYANGELPLSHVTNYDVLITSWGGASATAAAATPEQKALVYMSAISCKPGVNKFHYGVTLEEARAAGWILKDANGAEIINAGYPQSSIGDPGSVEYQRRWCENVDALLEGWGLDGVFVDDVLFHYTGLTGGKIPVKYPTQQLWMKANVSLVEALGAYLRQRGKYVVVNAGAWFPGSTDYKGDNDLTLWTALAPHVDSLNGETHMWHSAIPGEVRTLGAGWHQNWDSWLRLPALCEQEGIVYSTMCRSLLSSKADYVLCSMLLETLGTAYWTPGNSESYDRSVIWHSTWDKLPLGTPIGQKYKVGNEWRCDFANGQVRVDPVAGTSTID